jgi:predicted ABC-type ATPase
LAAKAGRIIVAAGTNGAGKSSIVGPLIRVNGGSYYNPDEHTRELVKAGLPLQEANAQAWCIGYDALQHAVDRGVNFAFETTLGGDSITMELLRALAVGRRVVMLYVGLATVDLHIQRVAERVIRGGHGIPEDKIRQRFDSSRANLLKFIGTRAEIRVWDNSHQTADGSPAPCEIFRVQNRKLIIPRNGDVSKTAGWAQPLVAKALSLMRKQP